MIPPVILLPRNRAVNGAARPAHIQFASESKGEPLAPYLGEWFGAYPDDREFIPVIEKFTGDKIEAT